MAVFSTVAPRVPSIVIAFTEIQTSAASLLQEGFMLGELLSFTNSQFEYNNQLKERLIQSLGGCFNPKPSLPKRTFHFIADLTKPVDDCIEKISSVKRRLKQEMLYCENTFNSKFDTAILLQEGYKNEIHTQLVNSIQESSITTNDYANIIVPHMVLMYSTLVALETLLLLHNQKTSLPKFTLRNFSFKKSPPLATTDEKPPEAVKSFNEASRKVSEILTEGFNLAATLKHGSYRIEYNSTLTILLQKANTKNLTGCFNEIIKNLAALVNQEADLSSQLAEYRQKLKDTKRVLEDTIQSLSTLSESNGKFNKTILQKDHENELHQSLLNTTCGTSIKTKVYARKALAAIAVYQKELASMGELLKTNYEGPKGYRELWTNVKYLADLILRKNKSTLSLRSLEEALPSLGKVAREISFKTT